MMSDAAQGMVDLYCRELKLPGLRAAYQAIARDATNQGQNYAAFRNDAADQAMVDARLLPPSAANLDARAQMLRTFQQIFGEEVPSIVLYHPVYSYVVVDPSFGGVQLPPLVVHGSDRFLTLSDWFTLTERVFRKETRP